MTPGNPDSLSYLYQLVFGLYMLVTTVVLINLLIAMMSDTYQRIQVNNCLGFRRQKLFSTATI